MYHYVSVSILYNIRTNIWCCCLQYFHFYYLLSCYLPGTASVMFLVADVVTKLKQRGGGGLQWLIIQFLNGAIKQRGES